MHGKGRDSMHFSNLVFFERCNFDCVLSSLSSFEGMIIFFLPKPILSLEFLLSFSNFAFLLSFFSFRESRGDKGRRSETFFTPVYPPPLPSILPLFFMFLLLLLRRRFEGRSGTKFRIRGQEWKSPQTK